jgi:hypothetical protein
MMMTVTANSALACMQYGILDLRAATLQLFAMYHGAPGWG